MFPSVLDTRAPEHLTIRTRTHRNSGRYEGLPGVIVSNRRPRRAGRSTVRTRHR